MHVLLKTNFYFYKFYVIEHIMYFVFNNNIVICVYIYEKRNLIKRFKLYTYNIVLYNGEKPKRLNWIEWTKVD